MLLHVGGPSWYKNTAGLIRQYAHSARTQACGCPVITTDDAPMNEVAGPHATYLPLLRPDDDVQAWASRGAQVLHAVLQAQEGPDAALQRQQRIDWAGQFNGERAIDAYEDVYRRVLEQEAGASLPAQASSIGPG
jgi:glycosyltransferase involved in cell wall biosynthesis